MDLPVGKASLLEVLVLVAVIRVVGVVGAGSITEPDLVIGGSGVEGVVEGSPVGISDGRAVGAGELTSPDADADADAERESSPERARFGMAMAVEERAIRLMI